MQLETKRKRTSTIRNEIIPSTPTPTSTPTTSTRSTRQRTDSSATKPKPNVVAPPAKPAPAPPAKREKQEVPVPEPMDVEVETEPTHFDGRGRLPILPEPQRERDLTNKDWKSIAESGLLQIAFDRSRDKWLSGELFELFYRKPKAKRQIDASKNPPADDMVKLGACTMSVEPHIFDLRLYTVRDKAKEIERERLFMAQQTAYTQQQQQLQQQEQLHRQQLQQHQQQARQQQQQQAAPVRPPGPQILPPGTTTHYGHIVPNTYPSIAPAASGYVVPASQAEQSSSTFTYPASTITSNNNTPYTTPKRDAPKASSTSNGVVAATTQVQKVQATTVKAPTPTPTHPNAMRLATATTTTSISRATPAVPIPSGPAPDPVIQLLATKASADPELKALMRVVASGKATSEELKTFQVQIDVLTPLAKAAAAKQEAVKREITSSQGGSPMVQPPGSVVRSTSGQQPSSVTNGVKNEAGPTKAVTGAPGQYTYASATGSLPTTNGATAAARPIVPIRPPKALTLTEKRHLDITAIAFDFHITKDQDRYLIPKHSILEYRAQGTELLCSFIYVDERDQIYQPVTLKFNASVPKTLEPFQRGVADPEVSRQYMLDIMEKYRRAPSGYLMLRLKRVEKSGSGDAERVTEAADLTQQNSATATPEPSSYVRRVSTTTSHSRTAMRKSSEPYDRNASPSLGPSTFTPRVALQSRPKVSLQPARSRKGRVADPTKSCYKCHTNATSLWRCAELDGAKQTLCNACGIKHKTDTLRAQKSVLQMPVDDQFAYREKDKVNSGPEIKSAALVPDPKPAVAAAAPPLVPAEVHVE